MEIDEQNLEPMLRKFEKGPKTHAVLGDWTGNWGIASMNLASELTRRGFLEPADGSFMHQLTYYGKLRLAVIDMAH